MVSKECILHFEAVDGGEDVNSFTLITLEKVKDLSTRWTKFACLQGDVARRFEATYVIENVGDATTRGYRFYRKCYARFTDTTR